MATGLVERLRNEAGWFVNGGPKPIYRAEDRAALLREAADTLESAMGRLRTLTQDYCDLRQAAEMIAIDRAEFRIRAEKAESRLAEVKRLAQETAEGSSPSMHSCCNACVRETGEEFLEAITTPTGARDGGENAS